MSRENKRCNININGGTGGQGGQGGVCGGGGGIGQGSTVIIDQSNNKVVLNNAQFLVMCKQGGLRRVRVTYQPKRNVGGMNYYHY
ncbi:hypothetical protein MSAN_02368700 [Mycena sanguinolenta]|uniref:Uncharacterized protein n=1 Tax=Mycena sanguinolenta TaxID=230812 RepID=A0A8H6X652_9AGAR|nr:hypothetical protein MSAN_02368700 [Mycena sanguinolenta]